VTPFKIAIIGAGGQLGSELLRQIGVAAVGLDWPHFDLTQRQGVLAALRSLRPQAVINAAAYTRVDEAETAPERCWAINADGVAHLAEACGDLNCPLVQISSDYVFGADSQRRTPRATDLVSGHAEPQGASRGLGTRQLGQAPPAARDLPLAANGTCRTPYREDDIPGPRGVYAHSKLAGERNAAQWEQHFIVRTCGLYGQLGPRSAGNFVATMLRLADTAKRVRVVADQYCSPSYVRHVARALGFLVLNTEAYGTYHIVNGGATSWHALTVELFRQAGLAVAVEPITTEQYGALAPRPAYSVLDTSKYHRLLGCPPMPTWQEGLREYLGRG
jgi:dTDP-4-dehydrorhamnose reductase